nr:G protein-coupled receptor [Proales similis]
MEIKIFLFVWWTLSTIKVIECGHCVANTIALSFQNVPMNEYECVDADDSQPLRFMSKNFSFAIMTSVRFSFKYQRAVPIGTFIQSFLDQAQAQRIVPMQKISLSLFSLMGLNEGIGQLPPHIFLRAYDLEFAFTDLKTQELHVNSSIYDLATRINVTRLTFHDSVRFNLNTSGELFINANIGRLIVKGLVDSFLCQNLLSFSLGPEHYASKFVVDSIKLFVYQHQISDKLIPDWTTRNLNKLEIVGKMNKFEPITWPPETSLQIVNLIQVLGRNKKFFTSKNARSSINFFKLITTPAHAAYSIFEGFDYNFPDSDFCLFSAHLQLAKSVFFGFDVVYKLDCSCTLIWLIRNYPQGDPHWQLSNYTDDVLRLLDFNLYEKCTSNQSLLSLIEQCHFQERIKNCQINAAESNESVSVRDEWSSKVDLAETLKAFKFAADLVFLPLISLASIFLNSINVAVLRSMIEAFRLKRGEANAPKLAAMYRHLQLHSVACVLLSFIFVFKPLSVCIGYAGPFCSDWYLGLATRLYKLLLIQYAASALFLFSNLNMLWFTLLRFRLNSVNKLRIDSLLFNSRRFSIVFLAISLLFAVPKLFTSNDYSTLEVSSRPLRSFSSLQIFDFKAKSFNQNLFPFLELEIALLLFKDIILPLVTFMLDLTFLLQLRALHKAREKKLNVKADEKGKHSMSKMIAINGIFFFLLRLPDVVSTVIEHRLFEYSTWRSLEEQVVGSCFDHEFPLSSPCENLSETSLTIYQSSHLVTFFLLFKFNTIFNKSFRELFARTKKAEKT